MRAAIGERNVSVPCSNPLSILYNPIWKINSVLYELSSLPDDYIPVSYGLLIIEVTGSMNGTTFQCLYHRHESGSVVLMNSSTGQLIIEDSSEGNAPV